MFWEKLSRGCEVINYSALFQNKPILKQVISYGSGVSAHGYEKFSLPVMFTLLHVQFASHTCWALKVMLFISDFILQKCQECYKQTSLHQSFFGHALENASSLTNPSQNNSLSLLLLVKMLCYAENTFHVRIYVLFWF